MEKVVIISSTNDHLSNEQKKVNEYLDNGWKVKAIHTATANEYVTVIFVLEK